MLGSIGRSFWGIIQIILSSVAIHGANQITNLTWTIVPVVVGVIGGLLVLLGGILSIYQSTSN
ncbi:MAG: hypothetical protein ABSD41_05600 [Candidatus Bathyarchaeia archaeon]